MFELSGAAELSLSFEPEQAAAPSSAATHATNIFVLKQAMTLLSNHGCETLGTLCIVLVPEAPVRRSERSIDARIARR